MGYADGLLTSGERVVHREKQHWWVFIWGAKWTILAMIAALLLLILSNGMESGGFLGTIKTLLSWVAAAVFIGGIALLFWTILSYLSQEYVVTNRRVIDTQGVVNKRAADSSLEKINDAVLTQSIFGRALDFGDLKILTASEAAISEFRMLRRPIEFKKAMLEAKHEYEIEVAGGTPAPSPPLRAESAAPAAAAAAGRAPRRRHREHARHRGAGGSQPRRPVPTRTTSRGRWPASPTCATAARSRPRSTSARRRSCSGASDPARRYHTRDPVTVHEEPACLWSRICRS